MRIALATWAYPPEKSGLSRAAAEIAGALAEAGQDVTIFTMDRRDRSVVDGLSVVGCGLRDGSAASWLRKRAAIGHLVGPLAVRAAVLADHRRQPFDVIEATNWYAPAAALAFAGDIPTVTRNSTPAAISASTARSIRDRIDRRAAMLLERASARASAGLISNTADHGATITALYNVPPPGPGHAVIGLSLPAAITRRGMAARYPPEGRVELLFVGRDEHRKGFDALLAAHAILAASPSLPDYRLTIVGVGDDVLASLPDAARPRTRALHRVPENELHDLFAAAHVVVAPSRYESFGLVYQEAMMFGRPIVACAQDASARLFIGATGAGLLIDRCDGPALAEALRRLIVDPPLRASFAIASRAASGRFTRATLAAETLAAYRSAIASKGISNSASSSGRPPPAAIVS